MTVSQFQQAFLVKRTCEECVLRFNDIEKYEFFSNYLSYTDAYFCDYKQNIRGHISCSKSEITINKSHGLLFLEFSKYSHIK